MTRAARLIIPGLVQFFVVTATAQPDPPAVGGEDLPHAPGVERADMYRLVKQFDFDERTLGHYEDVPSHWYQLHGEGLPTLYARGRFDDAIGHKAAPSFRLDIATGNAAYEYRHLDLTVVPESDYFVVGYIRAEQLNFAGAFVAAYLVNRFGERIKGSDRISQIVRTAERGPEPWQRVEIYLPGEFPTAHGLRLQFWILQDYTWRRPDPDEIDPVVRRDVYATAWFDDFSVYRLPRVQLRLSNPAGLMLPDRQEEFILEVNNATPLPLRAELCVSDSGGRLCHKQELSVPTSNRRAGVVPTSAPVSSRAEIGDIALATDVHREMAEVRTSVPDLAPGLYSVQLRLLSGRDTLLERDIRFAVLPRLPGDTQRHPDFGVDLGRWQRSGNEGLNNLLRALECGAVKVGIPMVRTLDSEETSAYFHELAALLRVLAENRFDAAGVILAPVASDNSETVDSARALVARGGAWRELFSPILAHFGALLPTWQLGVEQVELRDGQVWQPGDVEQVRRHFRRFMTIPRLAIPQPISAVTPPKDDIASVWLPAILPARTLPHQLAFLVEDDARSYWLQLGRQEDRELSSTKRAQDLARRVTLAKALNPGRVFLPAPFELSSGGGPLTWQPTEDFIVLRTLFHYLGGKRGVGAITPAPDVQAVVFEGVDSNCLVIWSWREDAEPEPIELYLGPTVRAVDIWGHPVALEVADDRTRVPVGPTPLIIDGLHTPLALLQASYRVTPTYVQIHDPEPRPVLTFRNPYGVPLSGEVRLAPPGNWQVDPMVIDFLLEPGETFAEPLTLTLPPRQIAQLYRLDVRLIVRTPEEVELRFPESLTVGLRDIVLQGTAYWQGDDLVIDQSLHNLSSRVVSFTAFCDAPGRARQEGQFLNVAPGQLSTRAYVFPNSRDELAGGRLHMGVREIRGARTLNQFAEVPR